MRSTVQFLLIALCVVAMSGVAWGQTTFYDGFPNTDASGNIGGTGAVGSTGNGWTTHSGTAGTITSTSTSLSYTGLQASTGFSVFSPGNNTTNSRDVNAPLSGWSSVSVGYFSTLVQIVDATNLSATGDYFMHFCATAGSTVTSFGGRLGVKSSGTGFRFVIQNTSGGTPTFTDNGADLSFGTTYLAVLKYDRGASPTVATLWVNPSSLGGTEPAGGVTNSSGTAAVAALASMGIREGTNTPKAYYDEVRAGTTWASVTPPSGPTVSISNTGTPSVGNITQGTSDVVLFGFSLTPNESVDFTAVNVTTVGTSTTSDLSNFRVFYDADNSGTINGGESSVSGSGIALANPLAFTITGQTGFSSARRYLLVADVAGGATTGHTFTGSIASASDVTTTGTESGTAAGNQQTIALPPGTSTITAGAGSEPATISSLINTQGAASLNFDFTITDDNGAGGDAASTLISQIVLTQGTGNDVADWTQAIAGAELNDGTNSQTGTVNAANLTFSSIPNGGGQLGEITDDAAKTYQLKVWLNSSMGGTLPTTVDGLNLVFRIQETGIVNTGSSLASSQDVNSGSTNNAISVVATKLLFTTQPQTGKPVGVNFGPVNVAGTDANNNTDVDFATAVTLSSATFTLASTDAGALTQTPALGVAHWTNLSSSTTGTGTVDAAGGVTGASSTSITVLSNDVTSAQDGPWTTTATWVGGAVPLTTQNAIINHAVTLAGATTAANVTVNTGGVLDAGASTLTVTSLFTMNAGSEFRQGGTTTAVPGATRSFAATSMYTFNGTQAGLSGTPPTFGNLNFAPTPSGNATFNASLTIAGDLTINLGSSTTEIRLATTTISRTHSIGGDLNLQGGILVGSNGSTGSATVTITGNLNITGGTFRGTNDAADATFNIGGNISNAGTWQQDDGSSTGTFAVNLNGASSQDISGANAISFENLTVGSAGSSLSRNADVTGILALGGTLTLGANTLTLGSAGSVSGASTTNYIVTNGAGVLTRNSVGATNTPFPVGTATSYNPATINNAGTPDDFSVSVKGTFDNAPNNPSAVLTRQWTISEGLGGGSDATVSLQYNGTDPKGAAFTYAGPTKFIGRYTGSEWQETPATLSGTDPYTVTASGFTAFSPFGIAEESGALPIQLSSFTGALLNNRVKLDWTTVSEINNYGFFMQKRTTGSAGWTEVPNSFLPGHGTTNLPQHYTFTDNAAVTTALQYRLKQVDLDGSVHYSDPIQIDMPTSVAETAPKQFSLLQNYPNPFNPSTEIKFSVEATDRAKLDVYNALGQKVATLFDDVAEAGFYYKVKFNAENLASGMYFYRLNSGKQNDLKKLLLLK